MASLSPPRLVWVSLESSCLGICRRFGIYLPRGYEQATRAFPSLYLLRGHEREWADMQDGREGLRALLERLIGCGQIAPLVVVLPGFMPPGHDLGTPVDWAGDARPVGGGSGLFEQHFLEVKRCVEERFRVSRDPRHCALDGFSMGGWSAVTLALRHPGLFSSVGAYDGSFMWRGQVDPRSARRGWDRLWFSRACAPFFRGQRMWDLQRMQDHNPLHLLDTRPVAEFRHLHFHLQSVAQERQGNRDRTRQLAAGLRRAGLQLSFAGRELDLDPAARHTWRWADVHLARTLLLHDRAFGNS